MPKKTLLRLNNIVKTFQLDGLEVKALRGISLDIEAEEMTAIIGPSGSGKSTLMHIIGCLDRPTSGKILLNGKNITDMSENDLAAVRNRQIGFIFQSFNLLSRTSALDNVAMPLIYANVAGKERTKRAREKLNEVGLSDRMDHHPNQLSGGQQQRVAIARALINDPAIILADEPTGNLDSKSGREILSLLKNLNKGGHTVIIVTHDLDIAGKCNKTIKLIDGKLT